MAAGGGLGASSPPHPLGQSNQLSFQEVLWAQGVGAGSGAVLQAGWVPCGSSLAERPCAHCVPLSVLQRGLRPRAQANGSIQCPYPFCVQGPEDRMGRPRRPVLAPRDTGLSVLWIFVDGA